MGNIILDFNKDNKAPSWFSNTIEGLQYGLVSLISAFSVTDIYTAIEVKKINFWLGIGIILLGVIERATGSKKQKTEEPKGTE